MGLSVWIAAAIKDPYPYGPTLEPWRWHATFDEAWGTPEQCHQLAHQHARRLRKSFCPSGFFSVDLVAVRPSEKGEPLWAEGMPDHYDLPPYSEDHEQVNKP